MSDWKQIVKGGWHPEKEGTTLKGQVGGLFGKGDKTSRSESHVARPISELRDPSSFAPPPKRDPNAPYAPPPSSASYSAPSVSPQTQGGRQVPVPPPRQPVQQEGVTETLEPIKPWRTDTTGLSTSHLPPPPGRRDGANLRAPPHTPTHLSVKAAAAGPPSLPPRLPPRSNTSSPAQSRPPVLPTIAQPQQSGWLNQGAADRLGKAGISVPSLGIGKSAAPPTPPARSPTTTTSSTNTQVNELNSRFSRFGASSSPSATSSSQGTTFAQKKEAMRTASNFHKDPSSVSLSDARSAASTANNFRQRHGEQVASGMATANRLGQRLGGVAERAGFGGVKAENGSEQSKAGSGLGGFAAGLAAKKKTPPPPPPKKKPELSASGTGTDEIDEDKPPPVPMATRPKF